MATPTSNHALLALFGVNSKKPVSWPSLMSCRLLFVMLVEFGKLILILRPVIWSMRVILKNTLSVRMVLLMLCLVLRILFGMKLLRSVCILLRLMGLTDFAIFI